MDFSAFGSTDLFFPVLVVGIIVLSLLPAWRICSKAGYPGVLSLCLCIPLVNLFFILFFAFSEWPIERELRELRASRSIR